MTFLNPSFLWALLLIAIPIIIHLFNFRRYTTVYFSQVKFLQNIKKETKSKSRIKNILLLIIRCSIIAVLVLVFAKPVLVSSDQSLVKEKKYVILYIDNSFSMESTGKEGILLESAKIKALDIIKGFDNETKFSLLTNNFTDEHQQFVAKEQMIAWVSKVQSSHLIRPLSEVNERKGVLLSDLSETAKPYFFMLSDFQKSSSDLVLFDIDSAGVYRAVVFEANLAQNLAIDSIWYKSPEHYIGKKEELVVQLTNYSDEKLVDIPISLFINDTLKTTRSISLAVNETKELELAYMQNKPGRVNARVELNDYPVTFDNKIFFNYDLKSKTPILLINGAKATPFISKLYALERSFQVKSVRYSSIPYGNMSSFKLIVLNGMEHIPSGLIQALDNFVKRGGSLLVVPDSKSNLDSYNEMYGELGLAKLKDWKSEKGHVVDLKKNHRLFNKSFNKTEKELDLPFYTGYYTFERYSKSQYEALFESESGNALFIHERLDGGHVFTSGLPLDVSQTNLMGHPLFVPLMYNIAMQSGSYEDLYHVLNPTMLVEVSGSQTSVVSPVLKDRNLEQSIQPNYKMYLGDIRLYLNSMDLEEGFYDLSLNDEYTVGLSFNHDRKESDMDCYRISEIKAMFLDKGVENLMVMDAYGNKLSANIKQMNEGLPLTRFLVLLVLLLLLAEGLVLRFLS